MKQGGSGGLEEGLGRYKLQGVNALNVIFEKNTLLCTYAQGVSVQMTRVLANGVISGSKTRNCRFLSQILAVFDMFTYINRVVFDIERGIWVRNTVLTSR